MPIRLIERCDLSQEGAGRNSIGGRTAYGACLALQVLNPIYWHSALLDAPSPGRRRSLSLTALCAAGASHPQQCRW
jgi:hypothetical protein